MRKEEKEILKRHERKGGERDIHIKDRKIPGDERKEIKGQKKKEEERKRKEILKRGGK